MDLPLADVVRGLDSIYWLCGLAAVSAAALLLVLQVFAKSSSSNRHAVAVKNKPRGSSTVLLVGPMSGGKTSFYGKVGRLVI